MPAPIVSQAELVGDYFTRTHSINGNLRRGTVVTSAGTGGVDPTIVVDPGDANGRSVARCRCTTNNSVSVIRQKLQWIQTGDSTPTTHFDEVYIRFRFRYNVTSAGNSECHIARVGDGEDSAHDVCVFAINYSLIEGSGRIRILIEGNVYDADTYDVDEDAWYDATLYYKRSSGSNDGRVRVWCVAQGGTLADNEYTEFDVSHDDTHQIDEWDNVCANVNKSGKTFNVWHAFRAQCDADTFNTLGWSVDDIYYDNDAGLGQFRDVSQDSVSIVSFWNPEIYRNSWGLLTDMKADIKYVEGSNWPPSDADPSIQDGPTIDLDESNDWIGSGTVTGLTHGTTYTFKLFVYSAAASATIYSPSRTLTCRTLPGYGTMFRFAHGSCQDVESGPPFLFYKFIVDNGNDALIHLGDWQYEASATSDFIPYANKADWNVDHTHGALERFFDDLATRMPVYVLPDDHEIENNYDTSYRRGYTDSDINPTGADGSARSENAVNVTGKTKGEVYDACREAFYDAEAKGFLNTGHAGSAGWVDREYFRSFEIGDILVVFLDTRSFRDTSNGTEPTSHDTSSPTMIGSGQRAWLEDLISSATAKTCIIFSQSPWGDVNVSEDGDADWDEFAQTERNEIEETLQQSRIRQFILASGDRHSTQIHSRFKGGFGGRTMTHDKIIVESVVCPFCKHAQPIDPDYTPGSGNAKSNFVYFVSRQGHSTTDHLRMFGELTVRSGGERAEVAVRDGDTNEMMFRRTAHAVQNGRSRDRSRRGIPRAG